VVNVDDRQPIKALAVLGNLEYVTSYEPATGNAARGGMGRGKDDWGYQKPSEMNGKSMKGLRTCQDDNQ
jgi:hypothetical protein